MGQPGSAVSAAVSTTLDRAAVDAWGGGFRFFSVLPWDNGTSCPQILARGRGGTGRRGLTGEGGLSDGIANDCRDRRPQHRQRSRLLLLLPLRHDLLAANGS